MNRRIDLIPVPSALGAPDAGVAGGPEALRQAGLLTALHRGGHAVVWQAPVAPEAPGGRWDTLAALCARLAQRVSASLAGGCQPWIIGGDHSIACGTWAGVAGASEGRFGLLWIDAHLDAHVP